MSVSLAEARLEARKDRAFSLAAPLLWNSFSVVNSYVISVVLSAENFPLLFSLSISGNIFWFGEGVKMFLLMLFVFLFLAFYFLEYFYCDSVNFGTL